MHSEIHISAKLRRGFFKLFFRVYTSFPRNNTICACAYILRLYVQYVQSVDISLGKTVKPQPKWPKVPFVDTCIMALIL